jgi:peptidoglycan/xylan/chitin deacetylase (PgdA/CDA1 family)
VTDVTDVTRSAPRRALLVLSTAAVVAGCRSAAASPAKAKPPRTSLRRTVAPSAAIREKCDPPTRTELRGTVPQKHVACGAADIALTIDDGPDPTWTPPVLALLARLDIRATFCVIGRQAAAHPTLVADVAAAGHQIANHTYTHRFLGSASPGRISTEIGRTTEAIAKVTGGRRPRLFRAPGGEWSGAVLAECAAQGLRPLDWSVDPRDWSRPGTASIVKTIMTTTTPGSIILEHDGGGDRSQTLQALTIALPRLLDSGYRFVQP